LPRVYSRILAALYLISFGLHVLDVFDLRLRFSQMGTLARGWTLYLVLGDLIAAIALWRGTVLCDLIFCLIVLGQLSVFLGWAPFLPNQNFVVSFHWITLTVFLALISLQRVPEMPAP
jgi:hypothetical protein